MFAREKSKPFALLIFPPVYDFAFYDLFVKPYGLLKLGKMFEAAGFRVRLVDCLDYNDTRSIGILGFPKRQGNGTGKAFRQRVEKPAVLRGIERSYSRYGIVRESIVLAIRRERPDIVLVSSGMTYWYPGVMEAVELSKSIYPRVPVVVGGVYASLCPEHCAKAIPADYVVRSDAVSALGEICSGLGLPSGFADVDGPMSHESFSDAGVVRLNAGCPFSCEYCASRAVSGTFAPGDPDAAFRNVKQVYDAFGTRNFAFYDDALLVNKDMVLKPFLEKVISSGMRCNFFLPNGMHLAYLDAETARLMRDAGFREIRFGYESSRPDFHSAYDRKLGTEMLAEKTAILREAGFRPRETAIYILAGLPGQRCDEVEDTIRHGAAINVRMHIAEYSPVPGTGLWREAVKRSCFPIEEEPLVHNNTIFPMQWDGFTLSDLARLKRLAAELSPEADL